MNLQQPRWLWLGIAAAVLVVGLLLPTPAGLSPSGHHALAVFGFAVVIWITEAVSYPTSAVLIVALGALVVGLGAGADGARVGTTKALGWYLEGFANSAVTVVGGALVLAAAMKHTNLDKRVALSILRTTGTGRKGILTGAILVGVVLAFFVPSPTARVGTVVPIMSGMVAACGLASNSRLAALLMITSAHTATIWNVAIKTAASQNLITLGLLQKSMGVTITWGRWFVNAAPWAIVMSFVLGVVMLTLIPAEDVGERAANESVAQQLRSLGPMSRRERRLVAICVALLGLWTTEGLLHPLDTATSTCVAVAFVLLPGVGVLAWEAAERLVPWGTLVLFAVGISMGSVLISTGAAKWVAEVTLTRMGIATMPILGMIAILAAFGIVLHLGFASATGLTAALVPIFIVFFTGLHRPDVNPLGMVLVQLFALSFGFLLPVNSPQNMVAYGTGAFSARDFLRTGLCVTIVGYALLLLMASTYWRWTGFIGP